MLPIGDHNPTRATPLINYVILATNAGVYALQALCGVGDGEGVCATGQGLVPEQFVRDPLGELGTLFTSLFLHGGITHVSSNLLFLHIFGDNVEDALGHFRYGLLYLVCGATAGLAEVAMGPSSPVPILGASGAIAGVLGGYLMLFPKAPIKLLNLPPLWLVLGLFIELPAWLVVVLWCAWTLAGAYAALGSPGGNVAFFAHAGGFFMGLVVCGTCSVVRGAAPPRRR